MIPAEINNLPQISLLLLNGLKNPLFFLPSNLLCLKYQLKIEPMLKLNPKLLLRIKRS